MISEILIQSEHKRTMAPLVYVLLFLTKNHSP